MCERMTVRFGRVEVQRRAGSRTDQIGVSLVYAASKGHILIDRELYRSHAWIDDRSRCREAHIPDEVEFATKPQLARQMLESGRDRCKMGRS